MPKREEITVEIRLIKETPSVLTVLIVLDFAQKIKLLKDILLKI